MERNKMHTVPLPKGQNNRGIRNHVRQKANVGKHGECPSPQISPTMVEWGGNEPTGIGERKHVHNNVNNTTKGNGKEQINNNN